jgi:pimeloyl-ACP methyl ester carboxylesterase
MAPDTQSAGIFDRTGAVPRPGVALVVREMLDYWRPGDTRAGARVVAAAPRGDGHPVLVLPALLKGDRSTAYLRRHLAELGYAAYGWRLGTDIGPSDRALEGSERRLRELRRRHARRVSLIGHSMGGLIAREIAKHAPASVRQVITLCSPFRPPIASNVELAVRVFAPWHSARVPALWADVARPPPVPTTAIYTRTDGVVSWQSCCDAPAPQCESVEVPGCHTTMARNPRALAVIADRLAQPEGTWRPYVERSLAPKR